MSSREAILFNKFSFIHEICGVTSSMYDDANEELSYDEAYAVNLNDS